MKMVEEGIEGISETLSGAPDHRQALVEQVHGEIMLLDLDAVNAFHLGMFNASRYVAKSDSRREPGHHLLAFHSLDVAAVLLAASEYNPELQSRLGSLLSLPPDIVLPLLSGVLSWHDLGKVGAFQRLFGEKTHPLELTIAGLPRYDRDVCPHWALSQAILVNALVPARGDGRRVGPLPPATSRQRDRQRVLRLLLAVSTGHHGAAPKPDCALRHFQYQYRRADYEAALALADDLAAAVGWTEATLPEEESLKRASFVLNGLFTVCDWLGSHEAFAFRTEPMDLGTYLRKQALPVARQLIEEIRPAAFFPIKRQPVIGFRDLFAHLDTGGCGIEPTPLQAKCEKLFRSGLTDGPMLLVIEDTTGSGKTEAGDVAVQHLIATGASDGAFIGLPTMATADSGFDRRKLIRDKLVGEGASRVLAHSGRGLDPERFRTASSRAGMEDGQADALTWFAKGNRRALLSDLGVGTVDQATAAAFRARFSTVRLWGLQRKVLVVDEVHAYDSYVLASLAKLLEHQARLDACVILLSATLPSTIRAQLMAAYATGLGISPPSCVDRVKYPLISLLDKGGLKEHEVGRKVGQGDTPVRVERVASAEGALKQLVQWAKQGRCAAWFRNTVVDAIEGWQALRRALSSEGLPAPLLLHSRYAPSDRITKEQEIRELIGKDSGANRRGVVLVATQAAEQSLDFDVDEMISDLSPIDSQLQRMGRRRRHRRAADGRRHDKADERDPLSAFVLLCPEPRSDAAAAWYERAFPRAAKVYEDHAALWLTARLLLKPASIPERKPGQPGTAIVPYMDTRPLTEAVYDEEILARLAPASLHASHYTNKGDKLADERHAIRGLLPWQAGYLAAWASTEANLETLDGAPTRLGENRHVLLLIETAGKVGFLYDGTDPLSLSSVRVRRAFCCLERDRPAIEAFRAGLDQGLRRRFDQIPYYILLRSIEGDDEDAFEGSAMSPREDKPGSDLLRIRYDRLLGLTSSPLPSG